ncbi:hypothetical protein KIL84_012560 [Mauremys mutica]|uniref:Uncharacterized protein n=1 Tax=Mauremys mutica TaxID=74926 RepID=A0A9D4B945_9SAUR|nr:hypothetical protein KIL84_012560 [Mauremys mutica]
MWETDLMHVFPPIPLIPHIIHRLKQDQVRIILVALEWPRQCLHTLQWAVAPKPKLPEPCGVAVDWLDQAEKASPIAVQHILLSSRKQSTKFTYLAKCQRFSLCSAAGGIQPLFAKIQDVLEHLLYLKSPGLSLDLLWINLAVISANGQRVNIF